MTRTETELPGVFLVQPRVLHDARGAFLKTYHAGIFSDLGFPFVPVEEFISISHRNVIRGMHFQLPPAAHAKLVYCVSGAVLDVVLDLRKRSGCYGRWITRSLSSENRDMIFIPPGCAHGFLALTDDATMVYQTDTVHAPASDAGVRWNSFGFDWSVPAPRLSERDRALPSLAEFTSPF
jgi:dTDP-4-dehydrorhamnose 3,5-epimerase/CDP-3, 6-dideoxy-D-glycero-D-glycero-4-hexulose-5-epimerase